MSLPRFYSRISDAVGPLLTSGTDLRALLEGKIVCLSAPESLEDSPVHFSGFQLAVNLCARLYPHIRILASSRVAARCAQDVLRINPACHVETEPGDFDGELAWETEPRGNLGVGVAASAWDVLIDHADQRRMEPTNMLTSLAAGAFGASELFRSVFAPFLRAGRVKRAPVRFNLLTIDDPSSSLPQLPNEPDIGRVHLVGAGAIGQAAVQALALVGARGTLVAIDPEQVTLSNLQRYVLTTNDDVGVSKCSLVKRALGHSSIDVIISELAWGENPNLVGDAETVCAAVDTEAVRIALQAGLPRRLYNAWTQPTDLGWSRHENFGGEPCLACLYWPNHPRPSLHELVAKALRQDELRVLAYLTVRLPIDVPVRPDQVPRLVNLPIPTGSAIWAERSLLDDVAASFQLGPADVMSWRGKQLADLYREGICGGALIRRDSSEVSQEMMVPLAHQSALAGIMLATQLLVGRSESLLRSRPLATEARLDLLSGLPQKALRPRQRTSNCICADPDFVERYRLKWS